MVVSSRMLLDFDKIGVLDNLLIDHTTGKNIVWATDSYTELGHGYARQDQITLDSLINNGFKLASRSERSHTEQKSRTRKHAEVFTPSSVIKKMNDCIDDEWFGEKGRFEEDTVSFTEDEGKTWFDYVSSTRLEITCGEAPFLTSRYDAVTGEYIDVNKRVGLLDRKLRVVSERAVNERMWWKCAQEAYRSVYGYEFQGDNLLLARLNLLMTFTDARVARFEETSGPDELRIISEIISWNIWQMDGLSGKVPYGDKECVIKDWKSGNGEVLAYNSMKESK